MRTKKLGETLLELEVVLNEIIDTHDLQFGDVLALIEALIDEN